MNITEKADEAVGILHELDPVIFEKILFMHLCWKVAYT